MGNSSQHIIHKINASVYCNVESLPKVKYAQINELIKAALEELDSEFDAISLGQISRFKEISIDIDLKSDHLSLLKSKLKEALSKEIAAVTDEEANIDQTANVRKARNLSSMEILFYFLKTGNLPWTAKEVSMDLEAYSEDRLEVEFIQPLVKLLQGNPLTVKRLVNQFSESKLLVLLGLMATEQFSNEVSVLLDLLNSTGKKYSKIYDIGYRLSIVLFEAVFLEVVHSFGSSKSFDTIWRPVLKQTITTALKLYPDLDVEIFEEVVLESNHPKVIASFESIRTITNFGDSSYISESKSMPKNNDLPTKDSNNKLESPTFQMANIDEDDTRSKSKSEGTIQVLNAGIVLLHPFIASFFDKVGLTENGQFISKSCQQRAVCLLHYIATGELEFEEQCLYFQKFICHYNQEDSIPKDLPISSFEKEEVAHLLQAVLGYWTSLKGTSAQGLRGNFLIRKGVLEHDGNNAIIHVEKKTADILLKQIPWTLNFAKWPWNPHLLTIKWS